MSKKVTKKTTAAKATKTTAKGKSKGKAPVAVPVSARMFRPGSQVENLFKVLEDGKPHARAEMDAALESKDPGQILTDLRRVGSKNGEFSIALVGPASYQMTLVKH